MVNNSNPTTGLSLTESPGQQLLRTTLNDYVTFLRRQPAFCCTAEQHQALIKHVAQSNELIKLVAAKRLRITRQLDEQKHDWISI